MKSVFKKVAVAVLGLAVSTSAFAGNPQRAGQAGASELLINPFAKSSGWADANTAAVRGLEGLYMNVAGLAGVNKTEVVFSNTQWLVGSGININNFALGQRVGEGGVLGISLSSFDYGEWEVTTEDQPEGTSGTIAPSTIVIGVAYSQKFTESIFGGVNIKVYNNNISNLSVTGVCFDAGVQYQTGDDDEWKFGITLKNIGPAMEYAGDGFGLSLPIPSSGVTRTFEERAASFELPAQLNIGGSYDILLDEYNRLTPAFSFNSNSFEKDTYNIGLEYGMKKYLSIRAGYRIFDNRSDDATTTAISGVTGGLTFDVPLNDKGSSFGVDYSYRHTNTFGGIHSIGVVLGL